MLKDFADLFAAEGEAAKQRLEDLKNQAVNGLEIALEGIPDNPSKRRRLMYVRQNIFPLLLKELEEKKGPDALLEPTKDSDLLAALEDIEAATKLKIKILTAAMKDEGERRLIQISNANKAEEQVQTTTDAIPEEAYAPLLAPGVLERFVRVAARVHGVVGDVNALKLITLVAVGAQLELLPNGRPLDPSAMLIAEPGRGKNYLVDTVVGLLPLEWYLAFESASASSMYYQVENDPDFLRHCFMYPNEIEAVDMLVAFLRPMLSSGKASRLTVNSNTDGRNEGQELEVHSPITTIIPTVRNKTDDQLQTRLLVAELEDYEGRVKSHAQAFSNLLRPGYAATDNTEEIRTWQAALRSLVAVRRVVFPLEREEFALDNDNVSHGARLWANLLGLMCSHALLEQRNREIIELPTGEKAVVATPDDYAAAYNVFKATSRRTVINLSETHRKILSAVHALHAESPGTDGFTQRAIAEQAGIKQSTVSKQKTFLVTSAKLLKETDNGIALVEGVEPSWWSSDKVMRGFPSPEQVQGWWKEEELTPPEGFNETGEPLTLRISGIPGILGISGILGIVIPKVFRGAK